MAASMERAQLALICRDVYEFVWHYTVIHNTPPDRQLVADALELKPWELRLALDRLRGQGRIDYGKVLMPTIWRTWKRHNVCSIQSGEAV